MILDEENSVLYLGNKIIKLTEKQNLLLSYLINTPDKYRKIKDVSKYVYKDEEKKLDLNYDYRLSCLVYRVNEKTKPYFEIVTKGKTIYKIFTFPQYNSIWLKDFKEAHKDSYALLDKKKKLKKLEKEIKELETKIKE